MAEYFNRYVVPGMLPSLYLRVIPDMLTSKLVYNGSFASSRCKPLTDIVRQLYMANHILQLPKTLGGYSKIEVRAPFTAVTANR